MLYKMKNGLEYLIREIEVEDAKELLRYVDTISDESDNLTFGKGEFVMTLEQEIDYIKGVLSDDNKVSYVAVVNDEIIGNISYAGGGKIRTRHCGEFGVAVKKEYWGQGIGKTLIEVLIAWAEKSKYCEKLNLGVNEDNHNAIALYEKLGFIKEGLLINYMKINGRYVNSLAMGRIIDK